MTLYISPYRRLSNLREAMDRLLEENLPENAPSEREMILAVDVTDVEEAYTITALIPGLDAESLNIEILNNTVTLRGEFKRESIEKEAKFLTCELPEEAWRTRQVHQPDGVNYLKLVSKQRRICMGQKDGCCIITQICGE